MQKLDQPAYQVHYNEVTVNQVHNRRVVVDLIQVESDDETEANEGGQRAHCHFEFVHGDARSHCHHFGR